jgi:predicted aspartyl protease
MLKVSCGFHEAPQGQKLLIHYGPALRVHVGFDPAWDPAANSAPVTAINDLHALIDTGARQSCIDSDIVDRLGLPHFDRQPISTCNGKVPVNFHLAQVHSPRLKFTQSGQFAAVALRASGFKYDVLLGRSFLSYMRLEYDGRTGAAYLIFE